jgi:two-component system OmpR family response regulator
MTRREADGVRILLVEDNADLRDVITRALREAGYVVEAVADGAQGDALAGAGGFDALILDWMLPGLSGVEICRRLRDSRDFSPIIMLTAKDEIADRIAGLDAGADDYLVKPFHVAELLARLRSIVRRNGHQGSGTYRACTIALDVGERAVRVADRSVALSAREFDLLEYLMRNADLTQTREAIEEHVWGAQFESSSNVVDVFVRRLRRKLGPRDADAIETVRGLGYRIRSH